MSKAHKTIWKFLSEQDRKGIFLTRAKELKKWARDIHMSPTSLHDGLKELVRMGYLIKTEKIVNDRVGVFYGINSRFRDWWLTQIRNLEQKGREINAMHGEQKVEALKDLIGFTMYKFVDFVSFYIHYLLQNADRIKDLTESIDTFWNWNLYPLIFVTAQACLRDKDIVLELEPIKNMEKSFQEYLRSDFYKNLRESGIIA